MSDVGYERTPLTHTLTEGFRVAFAALRASWLRAALAVLGVGIGVGVVVTMAALITGVRSEVLSAFSSSDPDNFVILPFDFTAVRVSMDGSGRAPWWDRPQLSEPEIRRIQRLPAIAEASAGFEFNASVRFESDWVSNLEWRGASPGWSRFRPGDFVAGRDFTTADVNQARAVVILSNGLAETLFGAADPVGKRIRVNAGRRAANEAFTVIGVYSLGDNVFGEVVDQFAVVPYTAADKRLKARTRWNFLAVEVVPREGIRGEIAQDQVVTALRSMRGLGPAEENNFAMVEASQLIDLFDQFTSIFFLVMISLSSVGMLVGGVGVIGIMLISVTERTREIGVRKAIGATRREILWQFLIEAALLTAVGGGLGLLIGWATSSGVAAISPVPARIPLWSVFAALALATVTGVVFGLLPAIRASKLEPVDALRYE